MKIFSGFNKKDKGIILFDGKEAEINNPRDAISMGISTIYQDIIKVPSISVSGNIYLGNSHKRLDDIFPVYLLKALKYKAYLVFK